MAELYSCVECRTVVAGKRKLALPKKCPSCGQSCHVGPTVQPKREIWEEVSRDV